MLRTFALFLFFVIGANQFAQSVLPFIENYSKQDYKGDNQIWSLTQGHDNALYFANHHYFLRYNGVDFEKYNLPNQTIIRSVFAYQQLIFTGSYNEFGYWKRENGKMKYYSLVPKKFFKVTDSEEVWKIFQWKGKIYFQTFGEMYVYDFKEVKRLEFPNNISYCFVVDNDFLVATVDNGIFQWDGKKFYLIEKYDVLKGKIIHSIEKIDQKIYFFTQREGVFVEKEGKLEEWNNSLNLKFKKEIINTTKLIEKNKLALGTSANGLYIIDFETNTFQHINKNSSLQNNSVLTIQLDKEKDLWLGLDNGIAHIETNSPYSYFTDKSGNLGSVYAISTYKNELLLGSNHGLFTYNNSQLKFVENSQGQIWNIFKEGEKYVIGHNDGTFLFENGTIKRKSNINGGWSFRANKFKSGYIQSNYTGIAFFPSLEHLEQGVKLAEFNSPIKDFIQLSESEILAAHNNKGLFYIKYDPNLYKLIEIQNISKASGINDDYGVEIFEYKGENLYYLNKQWYYFDKIDSKLKKHELFNENFKDISDVISIDQNNFAVVKKDILFVIKPLKSGFSWQGISNKLYNGKLINNEVKIEKIKNQYLLNIDDGFFVFNTIIKDNNTNQKIQIEAILEGKLLQKKKIPYGENLEVNVISEFYGNKLNTLYYSINQSKPFPLLNNKIVLNNLRSGTYNLSVFNNNGMHLEEINSFSFKVKLPWYASFWMILLYILVFSFILFMYYRWNKVRFKEKFKLKEEELKHAVKLRQMELEAKNLLKIQEYEKHILENQVQLKANELAGKSLSLAKQTELIESIQEILDTENNAQSLKSKIAKALKINRLNKNEWKSFENNLLKSNEEFVKNLTHKFPILTSKDIKLCIYLKMNLTSKEIAPLMNISYRGVELHRYRLRKKLNIEQEENLNSYMNNF